MDKCVQINLVRGHIAVLSVSHPVCFFFSGAFMFVLFLFVQATSFNERNAFLVAF